MQQTRSATCYLWADSHAHVPFDLRCASLFCMPVRGKEVVVYVLGGRGAARGTGGALRAEGVPVIARRKTLCLGGV